MIKKEKKSVQYFLKLWDTGLLADAVLCVTVCLGRADATASESCSSGSKPYYCSLFFFNCRKTFLSFVASLVSQHFVFSFLILLGPSSPTEMNSSVAGGEDSTHYLQPVKLSISITASPASLTGLLNSTYAGWFCSGFLCPWSSLVQDGEWRVQVRTCEGFLWGCCSTAASLLPLL